MTLKWSFYAQSDRESIYEYIEADSPRAAVLVDERICHTVAMLKQFPEVGRLGRVQGTRELVIQHTPYIVAYRIEGDSIRILRVLHGARIWPMYMQKQ